MSLHAGVFKCGLLSGIDRVSIRTKGDFYREKIKYDPVISFNINGCLSYKSEGFWGFSVEPGFIQKGEKAIYPEENTLSTYQYTYNYVQIPVLCDLYLTDKLFLSAGPELSYRIKNTGIDPVSEYSLLIGLNTNILKNIDLGFRYNYGLTYFKKYLSMSETGEYKGDYEEYFRYLQLFLRYTINISSQKQHYTFHRKHR